MRRTTIAVVLISALVVGCGGKADGAVRYEAAELGGGDPVSLSSLRGEPVLLVSWATWCRECDEELTKVQAFAQSAEAEGIVVVAVNLDAGDVDAEIAAKVADHGLTTVLWRDRRNDYREAFGAIGVPTTVLVDAEGVVAGMFPGGVDFEDGELAEALARIRPTDAT